MLAYKRAAVYILLAIMSYYALTVFYNACLWTIEQDKLFNNEMEVK